MNNPTASRLKLHKNWTAKMGLALGMAVLFVMGCASNYTRPLVTRGLPEEERKDYVIQNGFGMPENIKQAFLEGYPEVGMARELIYQMYGSPDRASEGDTHWEYVNNKGTVVTGFVFKNDKVEKIDGDPKGGMVSPGQPAQGN